MCDVAEYCDGLSPQCPPDEGVEDGTKCEVTINLIFLICLLICLKICLLYVLHLLIIIVIKN